MARYTQLLPVRMIMDVYRVRPARSLLQDEPLVKIQGTADLSPDMASKPMPIWFDAKIQFSKDGSFEIVEFLPTYGQVANRLNDSLFRIYKVALTRALSSNLKRLVGVS